MPDILRANRHAKSLAFFIYIHYSLLIFYFFEGFKMKNTIINSNETNLNATSDENLPRVFARLLTHQLSQEEIQKVAGGVSIEQTGNPPTDYKTSF